MLLETELEKGDEIHLQLQTEKGSIKNITISFFRGDKRLLFSEEKDKMLFPWGEIAFKDLIILLCETHGFNKPEPEEIQKIVNNYGKKDTLVYQFT